MKHSLDLRTKLKTPGVGKLLALFFWLALWQIGALVVGNALILPSPIQTLMAAVALLSAADFAATLALTMGRVFGGVIISVALGIVTGFFCGLSPFLRSLIDPLVTIIRTVPVVSVIILINLWLAAGIVPLVVCFLICFPIAWTNVVEGMDHVPPPLLDMAWVYRVPFRRRVKDIYIPALKPYMAAALMNAIGMGWKATVTAEVLANARPSVGMNLYYAKVYLETETLFGWTLIIVLCSYFIEKITRYFLSRIKGDDRYGY